MKAIGKYIIIQEIREKTEKTASGLIMGEAQKDDIRYRKGIVINPGTDVTVVDSEDLILYDRHAGNNIEIGDEVFKVILEKDIVVVV